MSTKEQPSKSDSCSALTLPELDQSKATALNTLASAHSRRSYKHAIEKFITWYCSEPRLGFNRSVVVRYRSFLESLSLSAAKINPVNHTATSAATPAVPVWTTGPKIAPSCPSYKLGHQFQQVSICITLYVVTVLTWPVVSWPFHEG